MERRRFIACTAIGVVATVLSPQAMAGIAPVAPPGIQLSEALSRLSALELARLVRPMDQVANLFGDDDLRLRFVEAAFVPVVHRANASGGLVTVEDLCTSVESLNAAITNATDDTLPSDIRLSILNVLETLPVFLVGQRQQPQTTHDQFGYQTMHARYHLRALAHSPRMTVPQVRAGHVDWDTVTEAYFVSA
jgi:hypothetical protein